MTSPLLALFARSLREDTRAQSTAWARAGLAAFMLGIMGLAASEWTAGGAPGPVFFRNAIWLQAAFLTIAGLSYFASAITEEKEDETLGLLRMTNLDFISILLGKSTSRLCGALLVLAAQIPFTLLAVTLGGVARGQILAAYATLSAYTFLLCNLALVASVIARRTVTAAALTSGGLLAFLALGFHANPRLAAVSPVVRLLAIFRTGFGGHPVGFQVLSNLAAGTLLFFLAWALFRRFCDSSAEGAPADAGIRRGGWFAPGRPKVGRAVEWKDFHFLHGGRSGSALRAVVYLTVLLLYSAGSDSGRAGWFGALAPADILLTAALCLVAELAYGASRIFRQELTEQTLAGLFITPLSLPQIVRAKVRSSYWSALPGALCLTAGVALTLLAGEEPPDSPSQLALVLLFVLVVGGGIAFFIASQVSFGTHLIAYLSLRMARGAFPLGIAGCLVANLMGFSTFFGMLWFFYLPFPCFAAAYILREKSLVLLHELAAEN